MQWGVRMDSGQEGRGQGSDAESFTRAGSLCEAGGAAGGRGNSTALMGRSPPISGPPAPPPPVFPTGDRKYGQNSDGPADDGGPSRGGDERVLAPHRHDGLGGLAATRVAHDADAVQVQDGALQDLVEKRGGRGLSATSWTLAGIDDNSVAMAMAKAETFPHFHVLKKSSLPYDG